MRDRLLSATMEARNFRHTTCSPFVWLLAWPRHLPQGQKALPLMKDAPREQTSSADGRMRRLSQSLAMNQVLRSTARRWNETRSEHAIGSWRQLELLADLPHSTRPCEFRDRERKTKVPMHQEMLFRQSHSALRPSTPASERGEATPANRAPQFRLP